jgi:hypothetical protein
MTMDWEGEAVREGKAIERSQIWFDPWLACDHPEIEALVMLGVKAGEDDQSPRRIRKRRLKDIEAFNSLARALVANAAYALALGLEPPTVGILLARPTRRRTRYDGPSLRQINVVLSAIAPQHRPSDRLVTVTRSRRKGVASVLTPGDDLKDCVCRLANFGLSSFRQIGGETIILRRIDKHRRDYTADTRHSVNVDYCDDLETNRMRAELERVNAALAKSALAFVGPPRRPIVDTNQRRLHRIFNTYDDCKSLSFDFNGRLHGGWWQTLEREHRPGIRIDGAPLADLDFNAMFLRLTYARVGIEPPSGDLYAGILSGAQDAQHRAGIKQVVNAMLALDTPLQRLPKGCKQLLPKGTKASSLRAAILDRHAPIRDQFEIGLGRSLMRTESNILVAVLLRLLDVDSESIALPMHDGLMVRQDNAEKALAVMRAVAREHTGFDLPAKMTPLGGLT